MRVRQMVTITGVAGLVVLAVIATAQAKPESNDLSGTGLGSPPGLVEIPRASAAGGSAAPLVYPAVVAVHLERATAAIARAEAAFDGSANMKRAQRQMGKAQGQMVGAWRATRYVIKTTPPPSSPPDDRAGKSGGAVTGTSIASPPDTSLAFFSLQHDLITHAAGLLGKKAALDQRLTTVMQHTLTRRNRAIAYIHKVAPPATPADGRAGASGGAVAPTFDATMPSVLPLLDDEIQAINGALALTKAIPSGVMARLRAIVRGDNKTKDTINNFWPPIVGDD